ncbi:MAG TPA: 30S ribosomal protein S4e [Candidatus Bathyarchaeia archaeon]|nr:30S ribosomal protein S4e [Candidatus Bathyarchaeia archaeon]
MARKFGSRQLKREPAPGFWPIKRKEMTWAPRVKPGPHPRERSLPLVIVLREILGYARTAREAVQIINTGKVKVDGVVRRDHRFPVGLMDVLQIEGAGKTFRILPKQNRGLVPISIDPKEAGFKLCKIIGKRSIDGGKTQLNFHDGRSLIVQPRDTRQKSDTEYTVGGAMQIGLPEQKQLGLIPFQAGALGLVFDGRNHGLYGKISSITPGTHARRKTVRIETSAESFDTPAAYVIPIGTQSAIVGLENR